MSDKDKMFTLVQKYLLDVPVILMGTGVTVPMGIPGMWKLSEHLKQSLNHNYGHSDDWKSVVADMDAGVDLENSLTGKNLSDELLKDIALKTWKFINDADLKLLSNRKNCEPFRNLSELIYRLYDTSKKNVNIITTNYDRAIEYACDIKGLSVDKRFEGTYIKTFSSSELKSKNIVNLFKIHGCLDLFSDEDGFIFSIPLQHFPLDGLTPAIIAPGTSKYESVLVGNYNRSILNNVDNVINDATCYLCYGYGFNDSHIQQPILAEIAKGKSIVVVALEVSNETIRLIKKHSNNFIIIQKDLMDNGKTKFIITDVETTVDGDYWSLGGFLSMLI